MAHISSHHGAAAARKALLVADTKPLLAWSAPLRTARPSLPVCRAASSNSVSSKAKFVYECSTCGDTCPQWQGKCPNCGAWNSMQRVTRSDAGEAPAPRGGIGALAKALSAKPPVHEGQAAAQPAAAPAARDAAAAAAVAEERVASGGSAGPSPQVGGGRRGGWVDSTAGPQRLSDVRAHRGSAPLRLQLPGDTGGEVSRVLGGGVMPGSLVLVGGDPGVGKSTLMLQVAMMLAEAHDTGREGRPVLYVSGEESVEQVATRAERMGCDSPENFLLYSQTSMDAILRTVVSMEPAAVVVDSIQTVYLSDVTGSAGSVSQVRECSAALLHIAKRLGCVVFVVGHVTKSGEIAGPRVLEHVVDVVLYLEGERRSAYRLLRGMKNRFGATDEVGVFEMKQEGLAAVADPSALFLSQRVEGSAASSAVTVLMEGSRPMCMEVQALCTPAAPAGQGGGGPRRVPSGVPFQRLSMLLAVLTKHASIPLYTRDVYINVVGGMMLTEPSTDLAVAVAIASSFHDQPVSPDIAVIGEVGLGGELRAVGHIDKRVLECSKLGIKRAVVPSANKLDIRGAARWGGMQVVACRTVKDALSEVLGTA